jgi:hypothetical protein
MHQMPGKGFTFRHTAAVARRNNARRAQQLQAQQQQQQPQAPQLDDAAEEEHEPEPVAEEALVQAMVQDLHDVLDTPENPVVELPAPTLRRTEETPIKVSNAATQYQLTDTEHLPTVPTIRRTQAITFSDEEATTSDQKKVTSKVELNFGNIPEIQLNALKGGISMNQQHLPASSILPPAKTTTVPTTSPVPSMSSVGSGIVTINSDTSSSPTSERAQEFNKEVIHDIDVTIQDSNSTDSFHSAPSNSVSSEDSVQTEAKVQPKNSKKSKKKSQVFSTESFLGPISKISAGSRLLAQRICHSSLPASTAVPSSAATQPETTETVFASESPIHQDLPVIQEATQSVPKSPTKSQDLLQETTEVCLLCTSSSAVWQLTQEQRANLRCTCETDTTLVTEPKPPASAPTSPLPRRSTRQNGQPKGHWNTKTQTFVKK